MSVYYLLFAGFHCDPAAGLQGPIGGWGDFIGQFKSLEDAERHLELLGNSIGMFWYEIVEITVPDSPDALKCKVVSQGGRKRCVG